VLAEWIVIGRYRASEYGRGVWFEAVAAGWQTSEHDHRRRRRVNAKARWSCMAHEHRLNMKRCGYLTNAKSRT